MLAKSVILEKIVMWPSVALAVLVAFTLYWVDHSSMQREMALIRGLPGKDMEDHSDKFDMSKINKALA